LFCDSVEKTDLTIKRLILCGLEVGSAELLPKKLRFIASEEDPNKMESMAVLQARKNELPLKIENRLIKMKTMRGALIHILSILKN
jgi:hypothetical protein